MKLLHTGDLHIGKTVNDFRTYYNAAFAISRAGTAAANSTDGGLQPERRYNNVSCKRKQI